MMPLSLRQTTDDDRRLGGDFIFWDSFGDREIPNFPEGPYIIYIYISIFWKLSLVSVNKMIGIPWKNEIVSRCPVITASELPASYTMSTGSVVGIPSPLF